MTVLKGFLPAWYLPNGTINAPKDQLEKASASCERWAFWCGIVVIASVIVEYILAKIEPPYATFLEVSAYTDIGVAVGIVGEVLLGMRNNTIQGELRELSNKRVEEATDRLAEVEVSNGYLQVDVAKATERAAKAELRTAEAQKEIEYLKKFKTGPRMALIDHDAFLKTFEGVPKAAVEIMYLAHDGDAYLVAGWLQALLSKAGWEAKSPAAVDPPDRASLPWHLQDAPTLRIVGGSPFGVTILSNEPPSSNPKNPSFAALGKILQTSLHSLTTSADNSLPDGTFRIVVGPKP
jgi:hypothetical protein